MKREMINMFRLWLRKVTGRAQFATVLLAVLTMWALNRVGLAQQSVQPTFPVGRGSGSTSFPGGSG
jgi:hypothetical protein